MVLIIAIQVTVLDSIRTVLVPLKVTEFNPISEVTPKGMVKANKPSVMGKAPYVPDWVVSMYWPEETRSTNPVDSLKYESWTLKASSEAARGTAAVLALEKEAVPV